MKWTEEELQFIIGNQETMTYSKIAKLLGRSRSSICSKLYKLNGPRVLHKVCNICNKEFTTHQYSIIACSTECKKVNQRNSSKYMELTISSRYRHYKYSANKREITFNLTLEDFSKYWKKPCGYCGDVIETIGLDRIENTKGYSIKNIIPCCTVCNMMKRDISKETWMNKIEQIYLFNIGEN